MLWKHWYRGTRGHTWQVLRALYSRASMCVSAGGSLSPAWPDDQEGTGQGRNVSPDNFVSTMEDLEPHILMHLPPVARQQALTVLYMDDIVSVLLALPLLPYTLRGMGCWGNIWRVKFNIAPDKTAAMFLSLAAGERARLEAWSRGTPEWLLLARDTDVALWTHLVF